MLVLRSPLRPQTQKSGLPTPSSLRPRSLKPQAPLPQTQEPGPQSPPGFWTPSPSSLRPRIPDPPPLVQQTQESLPPDPEPWPECLSPSRLKKSSGSHRRPYSDWDSWPPTPFLGSRNPSSQPTFPRDPSAWVAAPLSRRSSALPGGAGRCRKREDGEGAQDSPVSFRALRCGYLHGPARGGATSRHQEGAWL